MPIWTGNGALSRAIRAIIWEFKLRLTVQDIRGLSDERIDGMPRAGAKTASTIREIRDTWTDAQIEDVFATWLIPFDGWREHAEMVAGVSR